MAVALAFSASSASGEVFEIGPNGTTIGRSVHDGVWSGVKPLAADDVTVTDDEAPSAADVPDEALTLAAAPVVPDRFQAGLIDAATRHQVSPDLLAALVWQESRWQPAAVSPKGAIGLGQLMPATARALAVDPHDASANLLGAARYLRQMLDLFDGDVERALAAYNAGPARVLRANGVPAIAETRNYVATIIDRLSSLKGASK